MPRLVFAVLLTLFMVGCKCTPKPFHRFPPSGEAWDTTALIDAQPALVTPEDLAATVASHTDHYMEYVQVLGVTWTPYYSEPELDEPDGYRIGGDSALFTGFALANFCFEYRVNNSPDALKAAMLHLRGIYYLTHVAGAGVITRCAFPLADKEKFGYPDEWGGRISKGFVDEAQPVASPWGNFPASAYYSRGTKDQLTGLLFGLGTAWAMLDTEPEARPMIAAIVDDLRNHLIKYDWKIRDARGKNDTSADKVDGMLRLMFEALRRRTVTISAPQEDQVAQKLYEDWFHTLTIQDVFNVGNNFQEYFAHNLRSTRAFTIWLLEDDPARRTLLADYAFRAVWRYTHDHLNGWIAAVVIAMKPDSAKAKMVLRQSLQSLSLRQLRAWGSPYAGQEQKPDIGAVLQGCDGNFVIPPHLRKPSNYWSWQKEPWDVGPIQDKKGQLAETGLDLTLPFWVGKFFGAL